MKRQPTARGPEPPPSHLPRGGRATAKAAEYVGSFAVGEADLRQEVRTVHEQLRLVEACPRRRPVLLKFSLQGLKMCSREEGEVLLMAHALRRICYSTCRAADGLVQFAFVSRNPLGSADSLFCHLFVGSRPEEVQELHYLLCRFFQLSYLLTHPEEQDWTSGGSALGDLGRLQGASLGSQVLWKSLNPEEVSQNVNALVSFRRLPCPAEFGPSVSVRERLDLEETSSSVGSCHPGNPFCSPILVRKKAIRSKILRCGAYRGCTLESQDVCFDGWLLSSSDGRGSLPHWPENGNSLRGSVWSFAGIGREAGMALLRRDVLGAFLLWAEPGSTHQWCLAVRTRCGVIPYQIYRSHLGKYSVEAESTTVMRSKMEHQRITGEKSSIPGSPCSCMEPVALWAWSDAKQRMRLCLSALPIKLCQLFSRPPLLFCALLWPGRVVSGLPSDILLVLGGYFTWIRGFCFHRCLLASLVLQGRPMWGTCGDDLQSPVW